MSSIDSNEKLTMYSKSDSRIANNTMIGNNTDQSILELFDSLLHKYQIGPEQPMISSNFIFKFVSRRDYICNKISINRVESYIDSPK